MLIWLASYPRSGNTLTRAILKRCFGADSYSIYSHSGPDRLAAFTGHRAFEGTVDELIETARASDAPWFVKTHRMEPPGDRMIYVARDGRAAMASYRRFQRSINGLEFPIEQFVLGAEPIESWRDHIAWGLGRDGDTTLVLRYEDLVHPDNKLLDRISRFIGLPVLRPFDLSFAELRAAHPGLFGAGHNGPGIEAVESACPALFWLLNGEAMRELGYTDRARHWSVYLVREAMDEMTRHVARQTATLRNLESSTAGRESVASDGAGERSRC